MCGTVPRLVPDLLQRRLYRSHSDFAGGVDFGADVLHRGFILLMCDTAHNGALPQGFPGFLLQVGKYQL